MNTEKKKYGQSVLRRLVPAAAMLTVSAMMLSSATYAWFTMNKEVQMTGLKMSATAGEGIEISLGGIDASGNLAANLSAQPADDDNEKGWKSSVVVGNYYSNIGKLKPASSVDAENFFDALDASDKGRSATRFKAITLGDENMATVVKRDAFVANGENDSTADAGYYVDIPVHIRTSKIAATTGETGDIFCKLMINNDDLNKDLYKAVRVAFIPVEPAAGTINIFGCDDVYYTGGAVTGVSSKADATVITDCVTTTSDFSVVDGEDSGLKLPYSTGAGSYGHLDFTVRVWLEGQSTSCYDDKAGQSWNISLAFSLGQFETTTP